MASNETRSSKSVVWMKEVKTVSLVAAPMVAATLLQYLGYFLSTLMVGHLDDQLSLSAASIATAFSLVTGFTLLVSPSSVSSFPLPFCFSVLPTLIGWRDCNMQAGMAGGLETLCGQAYGAGQHQKLATYTYSAVASMTLLCFPISILWLFFTNKLLILTGQDHSISNLARSYSICLIPGLFAYALLQPMIRFFQTQSLLLPVLFSSLAAICVHVPLCWVLVFRTRLGCIGAGLSTSVSTWANTILLGTYMVCSPKCAETMAEFRWKDVLVESWAFLRFAVPSAIMTWYALNGGRLMCSFCCLGSYQTRSWKLQFYQFGNATTMPAFLLFIFLFHLIVPTFNLWLKWCSFSISYMHSTIPLGFAATISTRVSNELGAGNAKAAKLAMKVVMVLLATELVVIILPLLFLRHFLGYAFSSDKEIVDYVATMAPFLCLQCITDALQAVLSGVVRGSGKQKLGAFVNLGAYYLVGTPLAAILAFVAHLRGKGLLIGISTGAGLQASLFAVTIVLTNWEQQASKSRERIFRGGEPEGP
ncbi:unnamed protein product [Linum tenue]|uniref:Protein DETOXIFICATION n=1 Tax=Linum tenue TaxID=586396 RepID=A0AAV0RIV5_9ROSI|nr:unnamed protein product [Linum tenue]